jgi:hypothetical protein
MFAKDHGSDGAACLRQKPKKKQEKINSPHYCKTKSTTLARSFASHLLASKRKKNPFT